MLWLCCSYAAIDGQCEVGFGRASELPTITDLVNDSHTPAPLTPESPVNHLVNPVTKVDRLPICKVVVGHAGNPALAPAFHSF